VFYLCRSLRLLCEQRGISSDDMGPDEHKMNLTDSDVTSNHLKEINRLKGERDELRTQLNSLRNKVRVITQL